MYTHKSRTFLLKNHLKSVLGTSRRQSLTIQGRHWQWLEAGSIHAPETVVLLHGLAMSKNHWQVVMPMLAKHFRVIVPDVPGFRVGTAAANPELGFEGLAKELSDFLEVVVGRPTHLVGHSMSATLVTGLSLRMAVPVKSLILVSLSEAVLSSNLAETLQTEKMSEYMQNYNEQSHIAYVRSMFRYPSSVVELFARHSWKKIRHHQDEIAKLCQAMESELSYLEDYAASLSIPILIINGRQDLWRDITREAKCFNGQNVQRLLLDECRHLPFVEQPIPFVQALKQFLVPSQEGAAPPEKFT